MKIAILGWGSLIWWPENLNYDKEFGWSKNGPFLPIEFARISNNGRLTLVITENGTRVQTLYTLSNSDILSSAIENLRAREGTNDRNIGYYNKRTNEFFPANFEYKQNILDWINEENIDAVIWTNLSENWKDKIEDRLIYLKNLEGESHSLAKEYIIKAPKEITTKLRLEIENNLNWIVNSN